MNLRHTLAIGLGATALTVGAVALAHVAAEAAQNPIVVQRVLFGYVDKKGRFVATAGRGATNVERNALVMFVFSGAVDSGPNLRASLPLTLAEQDDLLKKIQSDPDYNPARDGYEIGVIPRRKSEDRGGFWVATGSVSPFSLIVSPLAQSGATTTAAAGQYFKFLRPADGSIDPSRILFNPRYQVATFNQPGQIDYNPEGFAANTDFGIRIDGGPNAANIVDTVKNRSGTPVAAPFSSNFSTTTRYIQDFSRPLTRGSTPSDGSTNVAYDADIEVTFDEPMNLSSFVLPRFQTDDQWTMTVRYTQNTLINGATLAGKNILGTLRAKPQTGGNVVQFRPLQGFGKGPYEVEVIVTTGVADLSGNNILRQIAFTFRTESNPNADSFSQLTENFANSNQLETSAFTPTGDNQDASWNGVTAGKVVGSPVGAKDLLTTATAQKIFDVAGPQAPTTTGSGVNVWYHTGIRVQMMYPANYMGGRARALNGFSWVRGVYQTAGRTYPNLQIRCGHASDQVDTAGLSTSGPTDSNFGDVPVTVVPPTTYKTINFNPGASVYVRGPDFVKTFNYNGANALIFDMSHNGDPASTPVLISNPPPVYTNPYDRWRADTNFPLYCSAINIPSNNTNQVNKWMYSTQFNYLTPGAEAQSRFYDIGRNDARLLPQQVVPTTQPAGTTISFLWQGAKDSELTPGTPDLATLTGWLPDIRQLANYRFARFRVTLINNTSTRTAPTIDILSIPFVWK